MLTLFFFHHSAPLRARAWPQPRAPPRMSISAAAGHGGPHHGARHPHGPAHATLPPVGVPRATCGERKKIIQKIANETNISDKCWKKQKNVD
jgi:hypothetical protein